VFVVLAGLAATGLATAGTTPAGDSGRLLADYDALVRAGCDPEAAGIHSPVVLRVLRNTPFARAGRRFKSADLDALYRADGDWYHPTTDDVALGDGDARCVEALRRHEARARTYHCLSPEAQAVLTADRDVYLWHRGGGVAPLHHFHPFSGEPWDACSATPDRLAAAEFGRAEWKIEAPSPATLTPEELPGVYGQLNPMGEATPPPGDLQRVAHWNRENLPLRTFSWEVNALDYAGEGESYEWMIRRRCWGPGPFMGPEWICYELGLP